MIVLQVGTFKVSELARIKGGADLSWDAEVSRIDSTVVMMKVKKKREKREGRKGMKELERGTDT
jgi:hypothetical protein